MLGRSTSLVEQFLLLVGAVLLVSDAPGASAAPKETADRLYSKCISSGEAVQGVMPAIFDCQNEAIGRQDAKLKELVDQILPKLSPKSKAGLRALLSRWAARRDSDCRQEAIAETSAALKALGPCIGTCRHEKLDEFVNPDVQDITMMTNSCIITETGRRIAWFKKRYRALLGTSR